MASLDPTVTGVRARRGVTRLEVIVLMLLAAGSAAQAIGAAQRAWEAANRLQCARNLSEIGQAMRQYAIDDIRVGAFPRTSYNPDAPPVFGTPYEIDQTLGASPHADPFATAEAAKKNPQLQAGVPYAPAENDVTAAFWLLIRHSDLSPAHFICPGSGRRPFEMPAGATKMHYTNWPGHAALRDHLSYSFHNMYHSKAAYMNGAKWTDSLSSVQGSRLDGLLILVADMNPGNEAVLQIRMADAPEGNVLQPELGGEAKPYNSPNHFGHGQNLLHADGAVRFVMSPFAGPKRDNIYTYRSAGFDHGDVDKPMGAVLSAGIVGAGFDPRDNILLPTAELLKQENPRMPSEEEAQRANESEPWRRQYFEGTGSTTAPAKRQ